MSEMNEKVFVRRERVGDYFATVFRIADSRPSGEEPQLISIEQLLTDYSNFSPELLVGYLASKGVDVT